MLLGISPELIVILFFLSSLCFVPLCLMSACWSLISAQIGSGVVRGGPEVIPPGFHQGCTRVPPGSSRVPQGSARAAGWCED